MSSVSIHKVSVFRLRVNSRNGSKAGTRLTSGLGGKRALASYRAPRLVRLSKEQPNQRENCCDSAHSKGDRQQPRGVFTMSTIIALDTAERSLAAVISASSPPRE